MAATEPLTYPLSNWTRPLTSAERDADIASDTGRVDVVADALAMGAGPDPLNRTDQLPRYWNPLLPENVPTCRCCGLPQARNLCPGCKSLVKNFGWPFESLEYLAVASKCDSPEQLVWTWKRNAAISRQLGIDPSDELGRVAAALSAYLDHHHERLLAGISVITAVPSREPLMATALTVAERRGWFSVPVTTTGQKVGEWYQHASATATERLRRSPDDWVIDAGVVDGQYVLVLDDVFVSGSSMFSYAHALRRAGGKPLRSLALIRHISSNHWNYWDALRIARRSCEYRWTPERAVPALLTIDRSSQDLPLARSRGLATNAG